MNHVLKQDIQKIINSCDNIKELHNKTIFVTGATGFIGSIFIKTLLYYNSIVSANIKIIAFVRSLEKAHRVFSSLSTNHLIFIEGVIENLPKIKYDIDYIIHGASITSSFDFVRKPVDTITTALSGTLNIFELARIKEVDSLLYLSSMEVYGIPDKEVLSVRELDYGYLDFLQPRSSYSESKRMAECLSAAYVSQYNLPIKIARLTQTIGPGMDYEDTRVAVYFARAVLENKDIILNTKGEAKRNVLYVSDAISALILLLIKGVKGEAYNIANSKEILSIAETAEMIVNQIAKKRISLKFDIKTMPEYKSSEKLNLNLNTEKIEELGWQPLIGVEEAYRRMITGLIK